MYPGLTQELRLNDPVGTRRRGLLRLGAIFALKEGAHGRCYTQVAAAPSAEAIGLEMLPQEVPHTIEAAERAHLSPEMATSMFVAPRHGWRQKFVIDPQGLWRGGFESDLRAAAPHVERAINIIIPDMSELNDWRAICAIVGRLRSVDGLSAEVSQWNLYGHTHASMDQPAIPAIMYSAQL